MNMHFVNTNPNEYINVMAAVNCLYLMANHDIDHFHHYFGNDQETKKKV